MNYSVNSWSFLDRGRAKCACCGRRIRRGGGDVLLRDLSGGARPRFYHLGDPCEAAAQRLIDGDPGRWRGARRHVVQGGGAG